MIRPDAVFGEYFPEFSTDQCENGTIGHKLSLSSKSCDGSPAPMFLASVRLPPFVVGSSVHVKNIARTVPVHNPHDARCTGNKF